MSTDIERCRGCRSPYSAADLSDGLCPDCPALSTFYVYDLAWYDPGTDHPDAPAVCDDNGVCIEAAIWTVKATSREEALALWHDHDGCDARVEHTGEYALAPFPADAIIIPAVPAS